MDHFDDWIGWLQKDGIRQGNTELLTVVSTHDGKGVKLFYGVHVMINGWYSGCS